MPIHRMLIMAMAITATMIMAMAITATVIMAMVNIIMMVITKTTVMITMDILNTKATQNSTKNPIIMITLKVTLAIKNKFISGQKVASSLTLKTLLKPKVNELVYFRCTSSKIPCSCYKKLPK